jgi:acetoin utilization deacetylase AcuC-like enzyme
VVTGILLDGDASREIRRRDRVVKVFTCDAFVLPLPPGHRFPMEKYARVRERVIAEGLVAPADLVVPESATDDELARAHDPEYVKRMSRGAVTDREMRAIGFPWSPALVERSRRSAGATMGACRAALCDGVAVNLAGGTHHAFHDRGEGYCVWNDSVVAARALQAEGCVRRVVVIDLDVHQGNGTAAITAADPTIFTFSAHGAGNYPARKERSDLDIEVADGTGDDAYLAAVERGLSEALPRAAADLAIYIAGADPFEGDRLGRLSVTKEGLRERDAMVFARCRIAGLPVAVTMGGGYARDVADTVDIHVATVRAARSR